MPTRRTPKLLGFMWQVEDSQEQLFEGLPRGLGGVPYPKTLQGLSVFTLALELMVSGLKGFTLGVQSLQLTKALKAGGPLKVLICSTEIPQTLTPLVRACLLLSLILTFETLKLQTPQSVTPNIRRPMQYISTLVV